MPQLEIERWICHFYKLIANTSERTTLKNSTTSLVESFAFWTGCELKASRKASVKWQLNMPWCCQPRTETAAALLCTRIPWLSQVWLAPCFHPVPQNGVDTKVWCEPSSADGTPDELSRGASVAPKQGWEWGGQTGYQLVESKRPIKHPSKKEVREADWAWAKALNPQHMFHCPVDFNH